MTRRQYDDVSRILAKTLMSHPSELQLCQYVDGLLEGSASTSIRHHLRRCPVCRETVEMLNTPCEPIAASSEHIDPEVREHIEMLVRNHT